MMTNKICTSHEKWDWLKLVIAKPAENTSPWRRKIELFPGTDVLF